MAPAKHSDLAENALPSLEDARAAFAPALAPELEQVRNILLAARANPPQLLHLEGGSRSWRLAFGLWWGAALNCHNPQPGGLPCLDCQACLRIGAGLSPDLICLDGRSESIKIGEIRELKPILGEKPRYLNTRLVLLLEAQALTKEAANAMLKSLEEPNPGTVFAFTVPQREKLLPTLISRGWVLTLPWSDSLAQDAAHLEEWQNALSAFAETGQDWFELSGRKGSVDQTLALEILELVRKSMSAALGGRLGGRLAELMKNRDPEFFFELGEICDTCQEHLGAQVNPALVLDVLATKLNLLIRTNS